jgi:hypothetical protein
MSTATPAVSRSQRLLRRPLVRALLGACVVVIAAGWYAFRPDRLFITTTVAEAAPVAALPVAVAPGAVAPVAVAPVAVQPVAAQPAVPSAVPPTVVAQGRFHSNAHTTLGTATVLDLGGGRRVLRLTGFRTSNGPDVRVVLVAARDVTDDATVVRAGYVELGALKGTRGDQNYELPASLDLARYRTVTIWCERFDVNFGSAPLSGAPPARG